MTKQQLIEQIRKKQSFLCVGLDTDPAKIPAEYQQAEDPVFAFNKAVIDATTDLCVAYKPNLAFYEAMGEKGLVSLKKTMEYIPHDIFTIADAKRGDIGNTSEKYAETFFNEFSFDSVTLSPYMGSDSIQPYLNFDKKWVIILAVTSNPGAMDFQFRTIDGQNEKLYEKVLEISREWGSDKNTMYVVGATRADVIQKVRKWVPDHFLLVPGVGAQGGSLQDVCKYGLNKDVGLLINSSRGIIYPNSTSAHKDAVRQAALDMQQQMSIILNAV